MCSSGAYFNLGHTKPRIKMGGGRVTINDIPAYGAFACELCLNVCAYRAIDMSFG